MREEISLTGQSIDLWWDLVLLVPKFCDPSMFTPLSEIYLHGLLDERQPWTLYEFRGTPAGWQRFSKGFSASRSAVVKLYIRSDIPVDAVTRIIEMINASLPKDCDIDYCFQNSEGDSGELRMDLLLSEKADPRMSASSGGAEDIPSASVLRPIVKNKAPENRPASRITASRRNDDDLDIFLDLIAYTPDQPLNRRRKSRGGRAGDAHDAAAPDFDAADGDRE